MSQLALKPLLLVILSLGFLWARSSYAKFTSGTFVSGLGETLTKASVKNPYPWFKQFLTEVAIPNSQLFGLLVLWGELLSALSIIFGVILLIVNHTNKLAGLVLIAGLTGGLFLNIIFTLGFGHTSPSTDSLNLLMAAVEIIGIYFLMKQYVQI